MVMVRLVLAHECVQVGQGLSGFDQALDLGQFARQSLVCEQRAEGHGQARVSILTLQSLQQLAAFVSGSGVFVTRQFRGQCHKLLAQWCGL